MTTGKLKISFKKKDDNFTASKVVNQADFIRNFKFNINTSAPVYGSERNSYEQMKRRSEKLIKMFNM